MGAPSDRTGEANGTGSEPSEQLADTDPERWALEALQHRDAVIYDLVWRLSLVRRSRLWGIRTRAVAASDRLRKQPRRPDPTLRLISVSGPGHSGTTLMATILGADPSVFLINWETGWFRDAHREAEARVLLESLARTHSYTAALEKSPAHLFRIPAIAANYPGTRFVVMVRDPRDVAASRITRGWSLDQAVEQLQSSFSAAAAHATRPDTLVVRLEDLITDFDATLEATASHVGLDVGPEMRQFHRFAPRWHGADARPTQGRDLDELRARRSWQVRQPLTDGRGRWRTQLSEDQVTRLRDSLGASAAVFGYDLS